MAKTVRFAKDVEPPRTEWFLAGTEPAGASARWALNGEDLGDATRLVTWRPEAGVHALSLVDGDRQILDTVTFEVRGRHEKGKHSAH